MDYRQLFHQANALAAYSNYSSAYNHAAAATNARTYSYRLWTLANVLTNESSPCALYLLRARTDTSQSKKNSRVALIQPRAAPGFIVSFVGLFSFLPAHRVIVGGPPRGGGRVLRQVLALQQRLPVGQRPARPLADGSPRERRGHGGRHGRPAAAAAAAGRRRRRRRCRRRRRQLERQRRRHHVVALADVLVVRGWRRDRPQDAHLSPVQRLLQRTGRTRASRTDPLAHRSSGTETSTRIL